MRDSLISVCLPILNGEKYLEEALLSIETQTYPNIEVIISDDGSQDSSLKICRNYQNYSKFPVRIFEHQSSGIGANWNNCITKAKGEYIKFLFQDDILYPDCISEMVQTFALDKDIRLVACKRKIIFNPDSVWQQKWKDRYGDLQIGLDLNNSEQVILDRSILKEQNFFKDPFNRIGEPTAILFDRNLVEEIGSFRTDLNIVLDIEFYYRVLTKFRIIILNKQLVGFRLHENQASRVEIASHQREYKLFQKILYKEYKNYLSDSHRFRLLKQRLKGFFKSLLF